MAEKAAGYEGYHEDLKRRYGLKDIYIAQGYMRGSDPSWNAIRPEHVSHQPGMTDIVLVQDDATLTGGIKPEWVEEMVREWEYQFETRPENENRRKFTRETISQHLALNRHREEEIGKLLLCGALWLAATHPENGADLLPLLKEGDIEIRYDITSDDSTRMRRFRLSMTDMREARGMI